MKSKLLIISTVAVASVAMAFFVGCESDAQTGALIGSGIGAGVGALAGGDTEATLIGAAVGGGAGYMLGNEGDKKETQQEIDSVRAEQNVVTVWITNTNGSQTSVRLLRDGPGFIGPKGERYPSMPTEDQLRQVYGF